MVASKATGQQRPTHASCFCNIPWHAILYLFNFFFKKNASFICSYVSHCNARDRREGMKDPWIQTGLHGRLHFFRLDRCIVQLSFKAMYVWPLSWLHPDPVPEPRNTRRASTVGLSLLICPRAREQCSDQLMETGGGGGCSGLQRRGLLVRRRWGAPWPCLLPPLFLYLFVFAACAWD